MTRIKEYQSDRNKYTKALFPVTGKREAECVEHWWDVRGYCVFCGAPMIVVEPPLPNRTQQEAYDEDERWAFQRAVPVADGDCLNYREHGLVCVRGKGHEGPCGDTPSGIEGLGGPSQSWHGGDDA